MISLSLRSALCLGRSIALGTTLAGCAAAPAPGRLPDVPPTRRDTVVGIPQPSGAIPASVVPLNYGAGIFSYDLSQTTVVTVGADSLGSLQDTLLTTASLTYAIQRPNDTLRIMATVDSLAVRSARDSTGPRVLPAPVTVGLEPVPVPTTQQQAVNPGADSATALISCDTMDDAARAIARDALIRIPPDAQPGQRWVDSTSSAVCRGGIPMTATTVSTFEVRNVQPRGDSLIMHIVRRSTLTLSGSGTQGTRRISVAGSGSSETTFSYELRGGVFLESQGQSLLQLRFETIQQTEQVTQRSVSSVRHRAPGR